jgi:hypothetical protein
MAELTYGRLDRVLRALGFSARVAEDPKAKVYVHKETGALVPLPIVEDDETVRPSHLVAGRTVLDAYGFPEATELGLPRQRV